MSTSTEPRAHRGPDFLASTLARLDESHIAPLVALASAVRDETGEEVPAFDPDSGGVDARSLLLLEAPGRGVMSTGGLLAARGGSGMVSLDNDDATAAALWEIHREASLRREQALTWNIVPWYIGSSGAIRAVHKDDLIRARPHLQRLMGVLPRLEIVVMVGEKARRGWSEYLLTSEAQIVPPSRVRTRACRCSGSRRTAERRSSLRCVVLGSTSPGPVGSSRAWSRLEHPVRARRSAMESAAMVVNRADRGSVELCTTCGQQGRRRRHTVGRNIHTQR